MTTTTAAPTIAAAARAIARKELSPVELTQACLDRIRHDDAQLHCFITLTAERALAEARAAEAEIARSGPRGPLHGIPIAYKDIYETAGIRTTAHSRHLEHHVPDADATTVRKLGDAGTVLMGKLATYEFALGGPSFDLPWPPTRNPWNPERSAGGSSSGTGAGIAAGFFLGGTGTDTGGSIRGPAAYCGIAGLKPTYGLVSRFGILPLAFSLDHAGPMARTAEDCALLLQAMAGYDPRDPGSANRPVPSMTAELERGARGTRIGVARHFHEVDNPAAAETRGAVDAAIATFRSAGATVVELTLPPLAEWSACALLINLCESFDVHATRLRTKPEDFGERLRNRLVLGALVSGPDYVQATRRRRELCTQLAETMRDVDVLLTAAVVDEAPVIGSEPAAPLSAKANLSHPANLSGYPAIAVCAGFGASGMPLSMQLIGKPFAEPTLLRVACAYERETDWHERRPPPLTGAGVR
jgi:aspartyl-tRNA(Asn)/glutamyl-tRNA(Gln) amidotransferase subunit A